jgi:general secretion pathway protein E
VSSEVIRDGKRPVALATIARRSGVFNNSTAPVAIWKGCTLTRYLGELLIEQGKLDKEKLNRALKLQKGSGERLGVLLVQLGLLSERDVAQGLAEQLNLPLATTDCYPEVPLLDGQITPGFLKKAKVMPLSLHHNHLALAMADPLDRFTQKALELATGKRVEPRVGIPSDIEAAFQRHYGNGTSSMAKVVEDIAGPTEEQELDDIQHLRDLAAEAPIIRLVNSLITKALEARASDIHIEPFENKLTIRYRIDGVLRDTEAPPVRSTTAAVISRIKVMANLNIAERRLPQDGRIRLRIAGREFDVRVSTVPTMHGESVVLRILDRTSVPLEFEVLGFTSATLPIFETVLTRPHGIVLVTGPTGSGKTTTLYAALQALNTPDKKILTVEDPVEYQLEGINQIQVKPQIGLTFAHALRSILRQDPDVIMVGEMRDLETSRIAVQAALTGHKVFSTLHTNDAATSVTRLLDMGVEDYLLTSTVSGVLAQRLVRKLCENCKEPYTALPELVEHCGFQQLGIDGNVTLHQARGCRHCSGLGYRGRTCILELLVLSDPIRQVILSHGDATAIQQTAIAHGMITMYQDGLHKVLGGLTTLEEVVRVTQES